MTSSNNVMTSINIWNQNLFYNLTLFSLTSLKKSTSLKIITSLCYEKTSNLKAMKLHTETWFWYLSEGFWVWTRHQNQVYSMFRTKVTNLAILSHFDWPKWPQTAILATQVMLFLLRQQFLILIPASFLLLVLHLVLN